MTQPGDEPNIVHVEGLESAEDLFRELSPVHGRLFKDDPSGWIFRGQANADWSLTPKAFRNPHLFGPFGIERTFEDKRDRLRAMEGLLDDFAKGLDRAGIQIPTPMPRKPTGMSSGYDPRPLKALAQHHGLPTDLLDWTSRAVVAAYFAASSAVDPQTKDRGTRLAVLALHVPSEITRYAGGPEVPLYFAPAATNPNLRAQAGLHSTPSRLGEDDADLEEHLRRMLSGPAQATFPLMKLTLPHGAAGKVLRLLSYEGIDGSSMHPGADGVVRAMRERATWDQR